MRGGNFSVLPSEIENKYTQAHEHEGQSVSQRPGSSSFLKRLAKFQRSCHRASAIRRANGVIRVWACRVFRNHLTEGSTEGIQVSVVMEKEALQCAREPYPCAAAHRNAHVPEGRTHTQTMAATDRDEGRKPLGNNPLWTGGMPTKKRRTCRCKKSVAPASGKSTTVRR